MELFIQIRDGKPHEHPIFGDNFREAFPHIDTNNLPPEFARFIRLPNPKNAGLYEVDDVRYEWSNGAVTDVWFVRPMTDEEQAAKDEQEKGYLLGRVDTAKKLAAEQLAAADTDIKRNAWAEYISALNAWVYVDWKQPNLPAMPRFRDDGTLLTIAAPGSAPDVTG